MAFRPDRRHNLSDFDLWAAPVNDAEAVSFEGQADAEAAMAKAEAGRLPRRAWSLITQGHSDGSDRSTQDFAVCCDLIRAGCSDDEIRAVFAAYPVGDKYREHGMHDRYLSRTIARARADVSRNGRNPEAPTAPVAAAELIDQMLEEALAHEPRTFPRTDAGNAELFAHLYGDRLRYDHRRKRWLLWDSHRWKPDPDAEVHRLAKGAARWRFAEAAKIDNTDERAREGNWAIGSEQRSRLDAALSLAQAEKPIADAGDHWDIDPWLLGVPNGVVDLRTGEPRPGQRGDRITMQAGAA